MIQAIPTPDSYEEALTKGTELVESKSSNQWQLGWLATCVPPKYGKATLEAWAGGIGLQKTTAYRYRWVAARFNPEEVNRFPKLRWSHFAAVAHLVEEDEDGHFDNEGAMEWLHKAEIGEGTGGNVWTVDYLTAQVAEKKEKSKPFAIPGGRLMAVAVGEKTIIGVMIDDGVEQWAQAIEDQGFNGAFVKGMFRRVE